MILPIARLTLLLIGDTCARLGPSPFTHKEIHAHFSASLILSKDQETRPVSALSLFTIFLHQAYTPTCGHISLYTR
jgi:hypothetical protein